MTDARERHSLGRRAGDYFLYCVVLVVRLTARAGLARLVAWTVARLAFDVFRYRRRATVQRLSRAGVPAPLRVARAVFERLARGLVELLVLDGPALTRVRLTPRAETTLAELLRSHQGAIVLTAHLANWDASACAVARRAPLTVVTKRLSNPWLDRLWHALRASFNVALIPPEGALSLSGRALREGRLVAMMIDQAPGRARGALSAPFLGMDVAIDLAPALLAARARAPVFLAVARRIPGGQELDVLARWAPVTRAEAEACSREASALLEDFVLGHPEDWLWLHRREGRVPLPSRVKRDRGDEREADASPAGGDTRARVA